ncbi:hypothetical protein OAC74_00030 [bacterium]|nr:hypothetical protein [bacterium]
MPRNIYDEIRAEFEKLIKTEFSEEIAEKNLNEKVLNVGIETLIKQMKELRNQPHDEKEKTDSSALFNSIERKLN